MSKRSRHGDNSKRQQPVQQQRAEAARLATGTAKAPKKSDQQTPQGPGADKAKR